MKIGKLAAYQTLIIIGIIMTLGVSIKLLELYEFSSDWFWLIAALGLIIEGYISLNKERRFEQKYKIVNRYGQEV